MGKTLFDCSPPGSSVHGILQARILEWVAIPFILRIFLIHRSNPGLSYCRQILYSETSSYIHISKPRRTSMYILTNYEKENRNGTDTFEKMFKALSQLGSKESLAVMISQPLGVFRASTIKMGRIFLDISGTRLFSFAN